MTALKQSDSSGKDETAAPTRGVGILAPAKINLFLHVGEKRPEIGRAHV